jgi:hypothetical protein
MFIQTKITIAATTTTAAAAARGPCSGKQLLHLVEQCSNEKEFANILRYI